MCGIVGFAGKKEALPILLDGLERLEYRGYDSAGVAVVSLDGDLQVKKSKGRLSVLREILDTQSPLSGNIGIGHTRWATHGEPNDTNAHPHVGQEGKIAVVHNGIIENYLEIKKSLIRKGIVCSSDTDTEVIVQLLEYYYRKKSNLMDAVYAVLNRIKGAYAMGILCSDNPGQMIAARKDAPLLIGYGEDGNYIASDVTALLAHTRTVTYMEDDEVAVIKADGVQIYDRDRFPLEKEKHEIEWDISAAEKGGYVHFMLKEIMEQPEAVRKTISPRLSDGEIEYEVIRDANDTAITVCNMENLDPVGIHTGDSIVVCPSQTLTNKEYQMLRDSALKIIRALKVEGGCNVQFALDPESFQYYLIEVNPRVSRSSALASKASGYPIARVSAKISVGMTLDEIMLVNTPASFETALDYVVTKMPRFPFDKFTDANQKLGTQMKATGEVMSVGRIFEESLLKAIRSLEQGVGNWELLYQAKKMGFSDQAIGLLWNMTEKDIYEMRKKYDIFPVYKMIDTCASEFESYVPYFYSTYEEENESIVEDRKKILVLGSGPIRIGQGVEFDYSTVHAVKTTKEAGYEAIIINNNPETVSTDYTTSDKLYFEPLCVEDVMNVIEIEKPDGIIASLGGQTAINLAKPLEERGVMLIGTDCAAIEKAENRDVFEKLLSELSIPQPKGQEFIPVILSVYIRHSAFQRGSKKPFWIMRKSWG